MRARKIAVASAHPATPPQLLSIPEVARSLSIGRTKVYSLIRDEGLPSVKVGSMTRVSVVDLNRWIQERTQGAPQEQTQPTPQKRKQRAS
jgi:excisionase family DNA binding protein